MKRPLVTLGLIRAFDRLGETPSLAQLVEAASEKVRQVNPRWVVKIDYPVGGDLACGLLLSDGVNATSVPLRTTRHALAFSASPARKQDFVVLLGEAGQTERLTDFLIDLIDGFFSEDAG